MFSGSACLAQQLSNQVLVPAAGLATAGVLSYSQTIGETAVELINNDGYVLTQGFQQPGITIESGPNPNPGTGVEVYPNPATTLINVKLYSDQAHKFKVEIINLTGRVAMTTSLEFSTGYYYILQMEVAGLANGFYFVRVSSDDGIINRIFKIEKM